MEIINKITFDMAAAGMPPYIDAVQGDAFTRKVEVTLMTRGVVFDPSDGFVSVSVAFKKPDGTAGWYDTLPDGNIAATVISDGVYQVSLAPEMFTVHGSVYALFRFDLDGKTISTFPFVVRVAENPSFNSTKSENYYNVQTWDSVNASFDEIFDQLAKVDGAVEAEKNRAVAKEAELEELFTLPTEEAVAKWLDEHPEATTTVQDRSLTKEKFVDQLQNEIGFSPDDFDGTDTEKLQACFDALTDIGGVITINRALTLTGNVQVKNNSDLNHQIVVQAGGKHSVIDMGEYHFYGVNGATGLVVFDNIHFKGTSNLVDGTNLIRLRFDGCLFNGFENVIHSERYIQSVNITNSYVREVKGYVYNAPRRFSNEDPLAGEMYDCHFSHNVVERSNGVAYFCSAFASSFTDNCIEGNTRPDDLFCVYHHMHGVEISNNYFEANNGALIDFSKLCDEWAQLCVAICNNHFGETDEGKVMIVMPEVLGDYTHCHIIIYGNDMPPNSNSVFIKSEGTEFLRSVLCFGNSNVKIIDPNHTFDYMEAYHISEVVRYTKPMLPENEDRSKRFEFMAIVVPDNVNYATAVVNTPFCLENCEISDVSVIGMSPGNATPTSVRFAHKYTNTFQVEVVTDGQFVAGEARYCHVQCRINFK